jgi:AcrR family transcriptional regulator
VTVETSRAISGARRTAEARRECIITAARSLFAQQGFHGTGMAQIARVSEVLVGQIYRDFAGKEDLIAAIVERDVSGLLDDPELAGAICCGQASQLNSWVKRFIRRSLDDEARRVLADILSEATRNPRIAAILTEAYDRLRALLTSAAMVWTPDPEKEVARQELSDLILTASGAVLHRQIYGLGLNDRSVTKLIELVDAEIEKLSNGA